MSQWNGTGGLLLWIDVDPALQREADAWYVAEHLPERVDIAHYRNARRYVAVEGAPRYLSIFEADTPDALASEGYLGLVRKISAQSQRIRAGFSTVVRNTFSVRASVGRGRGGHGRQFSPECKRRCRCDTKSGSRNRCTGAAACARKRSRGRALAQSRP